MSWFNNEPYYAVSYSHEDLIAIYELGKHVRDKAWTLYNQVYENRMTMPVAELIELANTLMGIGAGV